MLRFALVAAVCAAAVQTGLHLGGVWLLDGRFASLDAGSDRGIGGSAVVVAGEIAALGALVACVRARTRADALRLGFLAAALGFLGIDRVAALHDRIAYGLADRANLPHAAAWPTLIVYAPLLLPSAWILWFALPGDVGTRTARAGIVCLGCALAILPVALVVDLVHGSLPHGAIRDIAIAAKEGFALAGWVLVAAALVATAGVTAARPAGATRRPTAPA